MPLPAPPVPAKLREMLQDYPEHIERLQEALNQAVKDSQEVPLMPFDDAISALEGRLGTFISEARAELNSADASRDPLAIRRADEKLGLMLRARSSGGGMLNISDLAAYFENNTRYF